MKKKVLLAIVILVAILGTVVFATESPEGIMPINLEPTVDANALQNTTLVNDTVETAENEIPVESVIPEEWRRDIPEEYWRTETTDSRAVDADDFQAEEKLDVSTKTIDGNAFYAGKALKVSDVVVYGDLFVAGQLVTIDNVYVAGNVYIAGQNVSISEASITGNAYLAGSLIDLKEVEVQDVFSASQKMSLSQACYILRNLNTVASNINLSDSFVGRNANIAVEKLTIDDKTEIASSLNYTSQNEAQIATGATIGKTNFNLINPEEEGYTGQEDNKVSEIVYSLISTLVTSVCVCGFIVLFARGFIEKQKVDSATMYVVKSTLKGLLWAILVPIISILFIVTSVGAGVGLLILVLYVITFIVSLPVVSVAIAANLTKKMEYNPWKVYGASILTAIVIKALMLVPYINGLIAILVGLAGMGLIVNSLKVKKVKTSEPEVVVNPPEQN